MFHSVPPVRVQKWNAFRSYNPIGRQVSGKTQTSAIVDDNTIGIRKILFAILSGSEGSSTRDMNAGQV
jgi:hypothetical protein